MGTKVKCSLASTVWVLNRVIVVYVCSGFNDGISTN